MFPRIASKQRGPRRPLRQQPLRFPAFLRPRMPRPDSFLLILDKVSFSFLCFSLLSVYVAAFELKASMSIASSFFLKVRLISELRYHFMTVL